MTAPLIATERVRFSNNAAPCGGAVALYGWTQLATDEANNSEDGLSTAEYFSSLISSGSSQFTDTEFIENFAAIGGAIGGAPVGISEEIDDEAIISCLNAGPLSIVNSTFERNQVIIDTELPIAIGGGAIAPANLLFVFSRCSLTRYPVFCLGCTVCSRVCSRRRRGGARAGHAGSTNGEPLAAVEANGGASADKTTVKPMPKLGPEYR